MKFKKLFAFVIFSFAFFVLDLPNASASPLGVNLQLGTEEDLTSSIKTFVLVAALALAPSFMLMLTPYPYIAIVLGLTKQGLGTQSIPPPAVLAGIALFMSIFIMKPIMMEVYEEAYVPYEAGALTFSESLKKAEIPLKEFMMNNTEEESVLTFLKLRDEPKPKNVEELSIWTLIPAYTVSMVNQGLFVGLMIYAGFVVIDLIVGSVLMFMGMMMLPPQIVSLPFKLLIFVTAGGFDLVIEIILSTIKV